MTITKERTLAYHRGGKIGIELTQPCATQYDLSLAYTPGVAIPCEAIVAEKHRVFEYTNRANFVAVVSDGSVVLGLDDIGPSASAVAQQAIDEGEARLESFDVDAYREHLRCLIYGCTDEIELSMQN